MRWIGMALIVGAAAIGGAAPAFAAATVTVPAAQSLVGCFAYGSVTTDPRACSTANGSASVAYLPAPMLTATATYPGGSVRVMAFATANLTYYFTVLGGSTGDIVPIAIDYTLGVGATNIGSGDATLSATTVMGGTAYDYGSYQLCTDVSCADRSPTHSGTFHLRAIVGEIDHLDAVATAEGPFGPNAATAYAMVDPYIYIDPSFAHAADYRIGVSAGVGNAPAVSTAVPEPATWALLVPAFGLIGGVLRRRPVRALAY